MRERMRIKLKIISSLTMCLLSLFSLITLTVAWFAKNEKVDTTGLTAMVKTDAVLYGCEFYNIVADETATDYEFTKCDDASSAQMGTFSMLKHKFQLLVKAYIDPSVTELALTANTSTTYFLGDGYHPLMPATTDNANVPQTGNATIDGVTSQYTNVLSSAVAISVISYDSVTQSSDKATLTLASLPSEGIPTTFIATDNDGNYSVNSSFKVKQTADSTALTPSTVTETYDGKESKVVYILLDYDSLLLSTIFSVNLSNEIFTTAEIDTTIPFKCDFTISVTDYKTSST